MDTDLMNSQLIDVDISELEKRMFALQRKCGKPNLLETFTGQALHYIVWDDIGPTDSTRLDFPKAPDWKHPIPVKGGECVPSKAKRTKLRAKRKKKRR